MLVLLLQVLEYSYLLLEYRLLLLVLPAMQLNKVRS